MYKKTITIRPYREKHASSGSLNLVEKYGKKCLTCPDRASKYDRKFVNIIVCGKHL